MCSLEVKGLVPFESFTVAASLTEVERASMLCFRAVTQQQEAEVKKHGQEVDCDRIDE
jgi:hypothetical protein